MPTIIVTTCSAAVASAVCGVVLLRRLDEQSEIMAAHVALLVVMTLLLMTAAAFVQLPRHPGVQKPKPKRIRCLQAFPRYSLDLCDGPAVEHGNKDGGPRLMRSHSMTPPHNSSPPRDAYVSSSCDTAQLQAQTNLAQQHKLEEATVMLESYLWDAQLLALDIQRASMTSSSTIRATSDCCGLASAPSSRSQHYFDGPL